MKHFHVSSIEKFRDLISDNIHFIIIRWTESPDFTSIQ